MTTILRIAAAAVFAALIAGPAGAQDAAATIEPIRDAFEQAVADGDADAVAAMFAAEPTYMPITGDTFESREAIADYYRQGPDWETFTINATKTEEVGDVIVETGTFEGKAGDIMSSGEYVAVAVMEDGAGKLKTVAGFAKRTPPQ